MSMLQKAQEAQSYKNQSINNNDHQVEINAQYIQNLNISKETLLKNEKLISLKKYNNQVILAAKDGTEVWEVLCETIVKSY